MPESGPPVSGVAERLPSPVGPFPAPDGADSALAPGEMAVTGVSGSFGPIAGPLPGSLPTGRVDRRPSREGNRFDHRQRFRVFGDA